MPAWTDAGADRKGEKRPQKIMAWRSVDRSRPCYRGNPTARCLTLQHVGSAYARFEGLAFLHRGAGALRHSLALRGFALFAFALRRAARRFPLHSLGELLPSGLAVPFFICLGREFPGDQQLRKLPP